jgi:rubrerythrin
MEYMTEKNVQEAFGGECKAHRRYLFYAEKADKEGYPQLARLFRAVAEAELVHARNHLNVIDAIGTTRDNVLGASMGEYMEFTEMYPVFIETAKKENNSRAEQSFTWANMVEKIHYVHFEEALKEIKEGKKPMDATYYVCHVCGNTVKGKAPGKCPVCGAAAKAFKKVE